MHVGHWIKNIMRKYKVKLFSKAFRDIEDIYHYIANEKLSPENAQRQTDRIWDALESLGTFPQAHQDRLSGRYAGQGYKQFPIDNYIVIYRIDEEKEVVWIVTVQYQGRSL